MYIYYICIYIYVYIYMYIYIYVYYIYVYIVYIIYVYIYIYADTHTHTYIYIYADTHTYIVIYYIGWLAQLTTNSTFFRRLFSLVQEIPIEVFSSKRIRFQPWILWLDTVTTRNNTNYEGKTLFVRSGWRGRFQEPLEFQNRGPWLQTGKTKRAHSPQLS